MATITIAGLARAGGVGVETVRYYQRRGLLNEPERPKGATIAGGARRYGDDDIRRLRFIRAAQSAGFSLDDIRELLDLDAISDRDRARAITRARLEELDRRIAELKKARGWLLELERDCANGEPGPCPILRAFEGTT
ncbi:MerR family transcriptional regulator [Sphingomonas sp. GlSt437]|uniref:MerR family transcriptional regulator n=1 Tax=Sphingomonas sp. GlSt437 TaxID=3389970 RepID=UPI003A8437BA